MRSGSGADGRERQCDLLTPSEKGNLLRRTPQRFFGFLDFAHDAHDPRGKLSLRLSEVVDSEADERFRDVVQPVEVAHVHHAPSDEQASTLDEHGLATVSEFNRPENGRIFAIIAAP